MTLPKLPLNELKRRGWLLGRALRLVWAAAPGWTLVTLLLVVVQSALPLVSLYLMKQIIDFVAAHLGSGDGLQPLLGWLALALAVALVGAGCRALAGLAGQAHGLQVTDAVYERLHVQSVAVDLGYYEDPAYFDTLHRAQHEASYRPARILGELTSLAQNGISLLGIAVLLINASPLLGLLLLAAVLPGAALRLVYARKTFELDRRQTGSERRAWYYHWLLVSAEHAREVRLFNLGELFQARFQALRAGIREGRLALSQRQAGVDFLAQALSQSAVFGVLGAGAAYALRGNLSMGDLLMVFLGFQSGIGFMQAALQSVSGLYEDSLFLGNFYAFLDLHTGLPAGDLPLPVPAHLSQGLEFRGVSFSYPHTGRPALQDIDLELHPGQVVALVGENGSGKTTLLKLLCGLYQPSAGQITLEGIDLRHLDPIAWRKEIGGLFQDFAHYQLTAAENIRLGDVDYPETDLLAVEQAARLASVHDVIDRLPGGYSTQLGNWFEDGHELSAGEWQKIALARVFLRRRRFVVLDEPTSALDPLAEAALFARFRELIARAPDRCAILISHRFSTVQMADCIYVMQGGRITERGTHAELLRMDGQYARMFHAQAEMYAQPA